MHVLRTYYLLATWSLYGIRSSSQREQELRGVVVGNSTRPAWPGHGPAVSTDLRSTEIG